jgi:hypothetical protein
MGTMLNGRLKAFMAEKGELLLDMALPLTSGIGPPMTFMLDGKQCIAVMGGIGGGGGGPLGPAAPNTNPKMFVYSVLN